MDGTAQTQELDIEGVRFPVVTSSVHTELDVRSSFKGSKDKLVIDKLMNSDDVRLVISTTLSYIVNAACT